MNIIKRAAVIGAAAITVGGGAAVLAPVAINLVSAHNADATCQENGEAKFHSDSYPQGSSYSVDGGSAVSFTGGFAFHLPGTVAHTVTITSGDGLTQFNKTLSTPVCHVPETTTTVKQTTTTAATTTTQPQETTTTVCGDCTPNTQVTVPDSTTTTVVDETTTTAATTTTLPGDECIGIDARNGFPTTGQGTTRADVQPCGPGLVCRESGGTFSYADDGTEVCAQPVADTQPTDTAAAAPVQAGETPAAPAAPTDTALPVTGASVGWIAFWAALVAAVGAAAVLIARRRKPLSFENVDHD